MRGACEDDVSKNKIDAAAVVSITTTEKYILKFTRLMLPVVRAATGTTDHMPKISYGLGGGSWQ